MRLRGSTWRVSSFPRGFHSGGYRSEGYRRVERGLIDIGGCREMVGRPRTEDEPLSATERKRRHRERQREKRERSEIYFGPPLSEEEKRELARRWGWRIDDELFNRGNLCR